MEATAIRDSMRAAYLPGNSTVELREVETPKPGAAQVLLRMKASGICGSDVRAIYREHLGKGPEAYQGVIAGHEPAGQVVAVGPECKDMKVGDRVAVYHISGCGVCHDCRLGYQISCRSTEHRAGYGWQRNGGHSDYLIADEVDLIRLPENVSFVDGAMAACGLGTAYEALKRAQVSGSDTVLVTGLGPVGMGALLLARKMGARRLIGVDISAARIALTERFSLADHLLTFDDRVGDRIDAIAGGNGVSVSLDASGNGKARLLALQSTGQWGRCVLVGEGGDMYLHPSPDLIHKQITLMGSWVTSRGHMEELIRDLSAWEVNPDVMVTDRFPLEAAGDAYALMARGDCGKVVIAWDA